MFNFLKSPNTKSIVWVYIILAIISIFEVGSAGSALAFQHGQSPFIIITKQILFLSFGFIFMLIVSRIPYTVYLKLAEFFYFFALFLLLITLLFGTSINDSRRWIEIPILDINFQTSEFVKIAIVFIVAQILSTTENLKENTKNILKRVSLYVLPVVLLIMKEDNSTAFLILTTVLILLFIAPLDHKLLLRYLLILSAIGIVIIAIGAMVGFGRIDTLIARIEDFLFKEEYNQVLQAKIAVATGHFLIPVPGSSVQKMLLSHSYSDFIFAIITEEFGIWGAIVVLGIYLFLLFKVGKIINKLKKAFPVYLSMGIILSIILQAFVHILVNVGLIPVTGQPLPLISLGGTSIIMTSFALGILINIGESIYNYQNIDNQQNNNNENSQNITKEKIDDNKIQQTIIIE